MLERVSSHAVIRYLQRVLGLPVDEWTVGMDREPERVRCAHCCERAGLPVDAVRNTILTPVVSKAIELRMTGAVKCSGFVYVLEQGKVLTVMNPRMYLRTMGSRFGSPRQDPSKKRRKEKRRQLAGVV
jgi:hypothetical protein